MRRPADAMGTIRTEGGLLSRDLLERVAAGDRSVAGMAPEAYHLAPNEKLGEAITRSWNRLVGAWEAFSEVLATLPADERTATTITRQRWSLLLFQELGFGQLQTAKAVEIGDKSYPVSHSWDHVPIHLVGARVDLDRRTAGVAGAATMAPHSLVQELLNRTDDHLWAIVTNGLRLRLLRDNVALTRQAYVEFDLEAMFTGQAYADFALLWLVCHQSRFEADIPAKCLLEQWTIEAAERGTRALDQLRVGVEAAITALGGGFLAHPANAELRHRLDDGDLDKQDYYRQLLRTVYRLLFLFVAEGRDLLLDPAADATAKERYRTYYSVTRLRSLADARRGTTHSDQWAGLQLVMRALGEAGEPALALPGLGSFLWKAHATPEFDTARLDNRHLLTAIRSLSTTTEGRITRSVDYRNLGAEELGSIYESLLELHPVIDLASRTFSLATAGGHERKTTGSYYTPTSLITELLDSALDPVLDEAVASDDAEAALLKVTVLDPACGSGHFLIAAAHRIAKRLASVRTGEGEPAPPLVQAALREVVATCVHGVDVNEMAVELCKVSLWMEAMVPGKPLAFLDHRIVCGNSLLGTTPELLSKGVPDEAFKVLTGDDKITVSSLKKRNKAERAGQGTLDFGSTAHDLQHTIADRYAAIDALPDHDVAFLATKEQSWLDLQQSNEQARARLAADAWCAAFVAPKTIGAPAITTAFVRQAAVREASALDSATVAAVIGLREQYRLLHLHLAFPHVYNASEGQGFGCVLGNPPWERVKLQEKEFFAQRSPEVAAAPTAAARRRLIARLEEADPSLFEALRDATHQAEGESHLLRSSGRFPLCGRGDVNTYTVFTEGMRDAVASSGRAGVIVPSGIATDDTTKHFFANLVERRSLVSLFDFENRLGLFPAVHSGLKFCLLTMTGAARPAAASEFVFFAHQTADLADADRRFTLTPADFKLLNPNTRTCPVFRSRRDAELTKAVYQRVPVLVEEGPPERNPWGIRFSTMLHMTNDSHLFRTSDDLTEEGAELAGNVYIKDNQRWLPLYEAKMTWFFDHRAADVVLSESAVVRQGQPAAISDAEHRKPSRTAQPRSWVSEHEVQSRVGGDNPGWLLGFRDITSPTNARTFAPAVVPFSAVGNKLPLMLSASGEDLLQLYGILSSFVFDFFSRMKVGGVNFNFFIVRQLAVAPPSRLREEAPWGGQSYRDFLRPHLTELLVTADDAAPMGVSLDYDGPPFRWDPERRALLRAEMDACFFHLYGMDRDELNYIMETFPIVKRKDEATFGEFRTKRVTLEVYDAMAKAGEVGEPYQTILDPPPADPSLCHPESTRPDWARPAT